MDDCNVITESDVPGAKFVHSTIEEHTNVQLKRWLLCRGLTTAGKRCDLIKRCQNALDSKVDIDPKVDGGKWYELKSKNSDDNDQKIKAPILPMSGWKKFPSVKLPKHFNSGHIYHYIVESITSVQSTNTSDTENEDIHTNKPLSKGKNLFRSGHVKSMQDITKNEFYFVKSKVQASYAQVDYDTTLTISHNSGMVLEGTCTCSGSGLGRCSHVAALLFALEDFLSQFGNNPLTCTQQLCQWNTGRKKDKNPSAVFDISYSTMKKEIVRHNKSADFVIKSDPRPVSLRNDNMTSSEINNFLSELQNIDMECGWSNILDFEYSDFSIEDYGTETLKKQCQEFLKSLEKVCHNQSSPFCILDTENQNSSEQWHSNRQCRITASNAKRVACVKSGMCGLLRSLLWSSDDNTSCITAAIRYGRENESKAFSDYANKNPDSCVKETGLWVNPKYPQLGASPDGLVDNNGLIEIKCPYILKHLKPSCCRKELSAKQVNNFFCTFNDDGTLRLKRSHAYYYQIQMQLNICEKSFCDFIVWSPQGISVERIYPDLNMWKYLYPKLQAFHKHFLVPEYFIQRIPRELNPFKFEY